MFDKIWILRQVVFYSVIGWLFCRLTKAFRLFQTADEEEGEDQQDDNKKFLIKTFHHNH